MKIPDKILVGWSEWSVFYSDTLFHDGFKGKCYKELKEIHISNHICAESQYQTFIHEILHAVFEERGTMNDEEFTEEGAVTALAPLLSQVIQQLKC